MRSKLRPLAALAMSNQTNIEPASMPTVVSRALAFCESVWFMA